MTNKISWRNSDFGLVFSDIRNLVFQPGGLEIANSLFWGDGFQAGTLRYQDAATGDWVNEPTWMVNSGLIGTGTPTEVFSRDLIDPANIAAFPSFDESRAFTAILGGAVEGGVVYGYARLFGIDMPELRWDNTAENADEATARAEFAANAAAASADYRAQITALLAVPISGRIDSFHSGLEMHLRPDANTGATYSDFLGIVDDGFGRTYLIGGATPGFNTPDNAFGADETVEITLTAHSDGIDGSSFSAGTLLIDAAGGSDSVKVFDQDNGLQPDLLILRGGRGNDTLSSGAYFDTQVDGGAGNDIIDLTFGGTTAEETQHTLSGGRGSDEIHGARNGTNLIYGGHGQDGLLGGDRNDTIDGGDGRDFTGGGSGDDLLDGGSASDTVFGDDGQDTLIGGANNDVLDGGAGADTFRFDIGSGRDMIYGYEAGEVIQIDSRFWSGSVADFVAANVQVNGSGLLTIRLSATDSIRLMDGIFAPDDFTDAILFI